MTSVMRAILAILCIFVVTVCAILIVDWVFGRTGADLTEQELYTLSDGTRNILGGLSQPVTLKLYYARAAALKGPEEIRLYNNYFLYVRDLLNEYARLSNGMLNFSVIDPRKFSKEEEAAIKSGVRRVPFSEDENFYFGLVAGTEFGKTDAIPFFEPDRQEYVEYDISRLIVTVTQDVKKHIGVLSSLSVAGDDISQPNVMRLLQLQGREPTPPWIIASKLRKDYEIERLEPTTDTVCDHVDYLMVVHPKELSRETLYAIDQYVMRGGKLIVFVDPCCPEDKPPQNSRNPWDSKTAWEAMNYKSSSDLNALLRGWGVELQPDLIAVDRTLAASAGTPPEPLPVFMSLTEECINSDEIITAKLHKLTVLYAGALVEVPGSETTVTPLLTTTSVGNTWKPAALSELKIPRAKKILEATSDGVKPLMLACRISGKLKSNFPDGLGKDAGDSSAGGREEDNAVKEEDRHTHEGEAGHTHDHAHGHTHLHVHQKDLPHFNETAEETTVLVFADVDMITDKLTYEKAFYGWAQVGDNANLVFNALDYLGKFEDLIAIRSRGRFNRPFTRVDQIEADLEKHSWDEIQKINKKIQEHKERLRELVASEAGEDSRLLQSQTAAEREKIREDISACLLDLRELNADKREELERLKMTLMGATMVLAPSLVLLIAIVLGVVRFAKAKVYAARRPGK